MSSRKIEYRKAGVTAPATYISADFDELAVFFTFTWRIL